MSMATANPKPNPQRQVEKFCKTHGARLVWINYDYSRSGDHFKLIFTGSPVAFDYYTGAKGKATAAWAFYSVLWDCAYGTDTAEEYALDDLIPRILEQQARLDALATDLTITIDPEDFLQ